MNPEYQALTITTIRAEVNNVKTFYFAQDPAAEISYQAGQYLTLVRQPPAGEIRRSYSIVSSPVLSEPLSIGVKRIANGAFSRQLIDHAHPGEVVYTTGAAGFFVLPTDLEFYRQVYFCAAGSGITPVFSLLKTVLHAHPQLSAVLFYSNHSAEQTIFRADLELLRLQFPKRLQIEFLYSDNPHLEQARLHKPLLLQFLRQYTQVPFAQVMGYICGPLSYMRMCNYALREAGVPAANIRQENFSVEKPAATVQPPDTVPHQVTIRYRQRTYQFTVQFPQTILRAARAAGLVLPYSCEVGRCGNCVARCTRGTVWLAYNEVLTAKDLARNLTLTCVGYPVGGEVQLQI